ncbi:type 1 fimbrial protein [Pantoea agglomerans]|uniref:fimbrial protein n=1 Tax=Enterobacter agglomerans TaxID=549 RepID=UPI0017850379|nr:fimbrial protein [Pantoea agglomerans]MBD8182478.1 type 1 fimbrial protein [Pantoea agglomerans]
MKKNAFVAAMGMAAVIFSGAVMADTTPATDSTQVNFTGSITETPCSLDSGSQGQEVKLGHIAAHVLENKGESKPEHFYFNLKDCDITTLKNVSVKFTGTADSSDSSLLALGGGQAKGAGIAITHGDSLVRLGEATAKQTLEKGSNTLQFAAFLKGDGASEVLPGDFTSVSNVTFTYE